MNSLKPMLLTSLKSYDRTQFVKDVTAGIIVAIIALPLSIALALASGVGRKRITDRVKISNCSNPKRQELYHQDSDDNGDQRPRDLFEDHR